MTREPLEHLVLGPAPRPTTGADLQQVVGDWIRGELARMFVEDSGDRVSGLDRAVVSASMTGADVTSLDIDLTGFTVGPDDGRADSRPAPTLRTFVAAVRREEATLQSFRVRAAPATIAGAELHLEATGGDMPIVWAESAAGSLGVSTPRLDGAGAHLTVSVAADPQTTAEAIVDIVRPDLSKAGITVSDLELTLRQAGPKGAHVRVAARIKRGFVSARLLFTTEAQLGDDARLRLLKPTLTSRSAFIGLLLLSVRGRIRAELSKPIDLELDVLSPLRLRDVKFEAGARASLRLDYA